MAETNLAQLFSDGLSKIQTKKCNNLFKDLDSRDLTDAEESIIKERVALQQRMLEEYEKREKARQVREILSICPDLTDEEAECALKLHNYREEDAAAALTSGIAFRRKVQAMCGSTRPLPSTAGPSNRLPAPQCQSRGNFTVGPVGARPAGDFLKHIGDGVFVGTFRGKGWELYKTRPLPRPKSPPPAPPSAALPQAQHKKRGRPPKAREPSPPRPRLPKRRALGAANTEPPLSPPKAARRRRSGRLRSPGALPGVDVPVSGDEMQCAAQKGSSEPGSEAPVISDGEGQPSGDLVPEAKDSADEPRPGAEGDVQPLPDRASAGVLEDLADSHQNENHKIVHEAEERANITGAEDEEPGAPLAASPRDAPASPQVAAVPRRQRGSRRFRKGTPALPWTELSTSADPEGKPVHAEAGASNARQSTADQQADVAQASAAVSSGALSDEEPALAQQTPAAKERLEPDGVAESDEHPALQDHQVVDVSSEDAPKAKRSTRERASAGKNCDDTETQEAEDARPKRQRRASAKATEALLNITLAADMQEWGYGDPRAASYKPAQGQKRTSAALGSQPHSPRRSPRAHAAIRSPGVAAAAAPPAPLVNKPRLGRVKRCSSKQVELQCIGELRLEHGWHNNGYIFPDGFCTRTVFRSSVELDQLCMHTCSILGREGPNWPAPTFRIVAADRPEEVLDAKSPTGAWNAVLSRINSEIEARRSAGEDLPPPPKTAIAGPEYFGLTHPELLEQIEALDPEGLCTGYWAGKEDRLAYGQVHGIAPDRKGTQGSAAAALLRLFPAPSGGAARRRRRGGRGTDADRNDADEARDNEEVYAGNRWSGLDRAERARRRAGDGGSAAVADADNPLPHVIDPITLEPVVTPAMSPAGHVMGLATWIAVLAEQGKCPFTQQPLRRDQITVLTKSNLDRFQDRLKLP